MSMRSNCRLSVPLLLCVLVSLAPSHAQEQTAQESKWEKDIRAFEAADRTNPPPPHAILFIGSSSIRRWTNLAETFPKHRVINRGFGGSQISDSIAFAERIVIPYKPAMIVLYAGDNDIASGKTPERVFADFKAFVQKVHGSLPETRVAFIAIKPSPARERFLEQARAANQFVSDYARANKNVLFIDVFTPMLGDDGKARPELFIKDALHTNEKGYDLWASIVGPVLDKHGPAARRAK
jgi:lysophospholipase L1-like esterase